MEFTIRKILPTSDFETTKQNTIEALRMEGFGVLTEIDIQATLKNKLDRDYPRFLILGACNPGYADKVLTRNPQISAFLPCNVTIRQLDKYNIEISAVDPLALMGGIGIPEIEPFAREVQQKLQQFIDSL